MLMAMVSSASQNLQSSWRILLFWATSVSHLRTAKKVQTPAEQAAKESPFAGSRGVRHFIKYLLEVANKSELDEVQIEPILSFLSQYDAQGTGVLGMPEMKKLMLDLIQIRDKIKLSVLDADVQQLLKGLGGTKTGIRIAVVNKLAQSQSTGVVLAGSQLRQAQTKGIPRPGHLDDAQLRNLSTPSRSAPASSPDKSIHMQGIPLHLMQGKNHHQWSTNNWDQAHALPDREAAVERQQQERQQRAKRPERRSPAPGTTRAAPGTRTAMKEGAGQLATETKPKPVKGNEFHEQSGASRSKGKATPPPSKASKAPQDPDSAASVIQKQWRARKPKAVVPSPVARAELKPEQRRKTVTRSLSQNMEAKTESSMPGKAVTRSSLSQSMQAKAESSTPSKGMTRSLSQNLQAKVESSTPTQRSPAEAEASMKIRSSTKTRNSRSTQSVKQKTQSNQKVLLKQKTSPLPYPLDPAQEQEAAGAAIQSPFRVHKSHHADFGGSQMGDLQVGNLMSEACEVANKRQDLADRRCNIAKLQAEVQAKKAALAMDAERLQLQSAIARHEEVALKLNSDLQASTKDEAKKKVAEKEKAQRLQLLQQRSPGKIAPKTPKVPSTICQSRMPIMDEPEGEADLGQATRKVFGDDEAAEKIQTHWRQQDTAKKERRHRTEMLEKDVSKLVHHGMDEESAAILLQARWRGRQARQHIKKHHTKMRAHQRTAQVTRRQSSSAQVAQQVSALSASKQGVQSLNRTAGPIAADKREAKPKASAAPTSEDKRVSKTKASSSEGIGAFAASNQAMKQEVAAQVIQRNWHMHKERSGMLKVATKAMLKWFQPLAASKPQPATPRGGIDGEEAEGESPKESATSFKGAGVSIWFASALELTESKKAAERRLKKKEEKKKRDEKRERRKEAAIKKQAADGQTFLVEFTEDWKDRLQAFMAENGVAKPTGILDKTGEDISRRAELPSEPDFPITFIFTPKADGTGTASVNLFSAATRPAADEQTFMVEYTKDWQQRLQAFITDNGVAKPTGILDKNGKDVLRRPEPPLESDFPLTFIFPSKASAAEAAAADKAAAEKAAAEEAAEAEHKAALAARRKTLVDMEEEDW